MELRIVDCVTRFAIWSLIVDCKAATLISILINDWAPPLGKPRRIIADAWSPGMFGTEWGENSHAYVIQLAHAPRSTPYQNDMAGRVFRSSKAGIRAILAEEGDRSSQKVPTLEVMARARVPHTVAGNPPAQAMAGRCDILDGQSATAWTHGPDSVGPSAQKENHM